MPAPRRALTLPRIDAVIVNTPYMSLLDRLRGAPATDDRVVVRSDRHRAKLIRLIEDRIVDLETDLDAPVVEIQPLIQIVGPRSYAQWREGWERAWRKKGLPWSASGWPSSIPEGELAALLVPVMAGRVGPAVGRTPRPVAEPAFLVGAVPEGREPDDVALAVTAHWMQHLAPAGLRSAPPVVEHITFGRVESRAVQTFEIAWSLPPADGL